MFSLAAAITVLFLVVWVVSALAKHHMSAKEAIKAGGCGGAGANATDAEQAFADGVCM